MAASPSHGRAGAGFPPIKDLYEPPWHSAGIEMAAFSAHSSWESSAVVPDSATLGLLKWTPLREASATQSVTQQIDFHGTRHRQVCLFAAGEPARCRFFLLATWALAHDDDACRAGDRILSRDQG
ncbi:hypothetical protein PGQ11_003386 [Apiospora arundinis]|uniref:Uncharacterized protein n=1 Tax=Apiospora arundinis TaxID=335852 RepID=A0ABR2J625_9PEZI